MKIAIEFKPQDLWIGVYWRRQQGIYNGLLTDDWSWRTYRQIDVWICIVPMLPIHITNRRILKEVK